MLCRKCSTEVPPRRFTFCSDECVHEWKLQTRPAYVRQCLLKRDKGICRQCGFDAHALKKRLAKLKKENPRAFHAAWEEMLERGVPAHRKTFWDADHIQAVFEGGGLCGLDNYQTLCVFCHKAKTKTQATKRAATKAGVPVVTGQ